MVSKIGVSQNGISRKRRKLREAPGKNRVQQGDEREKSGARARAAIPSRSQLIVQSAVNVHKTVVQQVHATRRNAPRRAAPRRRLRSTDEFARTTRRSLPSSQANEEATIEPINREKKYSRVCRFNARFYIYAPKIGARCLRAILLIRKTRSPRDTIFAIALIRSIE